MAFPVNGILDDFTRANGALGANWTTPITAQSGYTGTSEISGNACRRQAGTTNSAATWNVSTFGPDCEVYATVAADPTTFPYLFLRSTSSSSNLTSYLIAVISGTGLLIVKSVAGTQTNLGSTFTQTVSTGDSFGMSAVGSTLTAYYKASAGSWTSLGSVTDSSIAGAGYIGLQNSQNANSSHDNFGGGTLTSATSGFDFGGSASAYLLLKKKGRL